jgi:hypothetical protein
MVDVPGRITARVAPFVKEELKRLRRDAAEAMAVRPAPQDDIVAALIHAATTTSVVKALKSYYLDARPWEDEKD